MCGREGTQNFSGEVTVFKTKINPGQKNDQHTVMQVSVKNLWYIEVKFCISEVTPWITEKNPGQHSTVTWTTQVLCYSE